jgi:hypothetical protein
MTVKVPTPLKKVTGLLNIITDNHINKARLTVFAILILKKFDFK